MPRRHTLHVGSEDAGRRLDQLLDAQVPALSRGFARELISRGAAYVDRRMKRASHQVRAHLAAVGHPILGDSKYGDEADLGRIALHAAVLGFTHPATGEPLVFESPLPADLVRLLEQAGPVG
jgi:23S rRNA pseudouridine1911/1915/1917 synthase